MTIDNQNMNIKISNFYSLKYVDFKLSKGINVLAGKNGAGKSQLLMTIAHQYGNQTLRQSGFENLDSKSIQITPKPNKVL